MIFITRQITSIVKQLPLQDRKKVLDFSKKVFNDDTASKSDKKYIKKALNEFKRGETTSLEQIDWN